nr:CsgE family curli-type amyloid fiber assembly protein [Halopseudomonas pelagia]
MSPVSSAPRSAWRWPAWTLVWFLAWWMLSAHADVNTDIDAGAEAEAGGDAAVDDAAAADDAILAGFVVNDTISNIGHEFYRYFSERLRDGDELDVNLVVHERPSARWGSLIWVELDGVILYQRFLPPNTSLLQPVAYSAADWIREAIAQQSLERMFQDNFDIEGDEL